MLALISRPFRCASPGRRMSSNSRRRPLARFLRWFAVTQRRLFESNAHMGYYARRVVFPLLLSSVLLAGCYGGKERNAYIPGNGGSAQAGKIVMLKYKCGSCHTIPGIRHANGVFGPPLYRIAARSIIGGNFPNTPDTLEHWVMNPPSMKPKTAMPNLGLSQNEARDVVAYLETLR